MEKDSDQAKNVSVRKTRFIIIIVIAVISLMMLLITLSLLRSTNPSPETVTEYSDPLSGETTYDIAGKDNEVVGENPNTPTVLGFNQLVEIGVTAAEMNYIRSNIVSYVMKKQQTTYKDTVSYVKDSYSYKTREDSKSEYVIKFGVNGGDIHESKIVYDIVDDSINLVITKDGNEVHSVSSVIPY